MRITSRSAIVSLLCCAALTGCGGGSKQAASRREQAAALAGEGLTAFDNRDYATAIAKLSDPVENGGLNVDAYCSAAVKLAVAYAHEGKYAEAETLLAKLEQGAPNLDQIYAARAFLLTKQGKAADARTALAKARQFNRTIQEFK
jgi:Tfp pilus assembly protein PilF